MALTGLQIYKLLPQTNCKECGFPTCLAFAMKLAAKQAELSSCPYLSDGAKVQLESAAAPPIRLATIRNNGYAVKAGNETVLFRHEKTFYHPPGLFVRVRDSQPLNEARELAAQVASYSVEYVGLDLTLDGMAVESETGDPARFKACVAAVHEATPRGLILMSDDPAVLEAGLAAASGATPLLYSANAGNWAAMADLAKKAKTPLVIRSAGGLDELADIAQKVQGAGVQELVLDTGKRDFAGSLASMTQVRRLCLKKNFRALGFPMIAFPGETAKQALRDAGDEVALAGQHIAKYAGFIVLDHFSPAEAYPLLVLRQNIYTDPQKPIQVQPGLYELNNPTADSPVMVTTNFSITYFAVANEVESSKIPGWLLVADAEGMSVLTAWAAGKFDASTIARAVKSTGVADKVSHRKLIIPGLAAVLSGELEEELPDWQIQVGPREAVNLPTFLRLGL
jgi:acetyl-CoA decarbonylase/synthase complex subunit gamma